MFDGSVDSDAADGSSRSPSGSPLPPTRPLVRELDPIDDS